MSVALKVASKSVNHGYQDPDIFYNLMMQNPSNIHTALKQFIKCIPNQFLLQAFCLSVKNKLLYRLN